MEAIEEVLKELGNTSSLERPLRNRVQELQKKFDEYRTCCFFAQVVPKKPGPAKPKSAP